MHIGHIPIEINHFVVMSMEPTKLLEIANHLREAKRVREVLELAQSAGHDVSLALATLTPPQLIDDDMPW